VADQHLSLDVQVRVHTDVRNELCYLLI